MLTFTIVLIIAIAAMTIITYIYYFKPKAEIKRYASLFKLIGYKVYEQPFTFLGLSFATDWEKGIKLHKDAQYYEAKIFSEIDICIGNLLDKVMIYFVNPQLIQQFLSPNAIGVYPKFEMTSGVRIAVGEGIVFSEGSTWKNKRKLMSKVFNFQLLKQNIPKMIHICDKCFNLYEQRFKDGVNKYKYNVLNLSASMFNGVMMRCFFGSNQVDTKIDGRTYEQFVLLTIAEAAELAIQPTFIIFGKKCWKFPLTSRVRKAKKNIELLRANTMQIMKSRTEQVANSPKAQKCTDIVQALVYEKMANKQLFSYSDTDLLDEFQTFLVAGTDTTSHYFTMMVYYIGKYPEVHMKLRQEISSIIKTNDDITFQNLKKLTYVDWIQYETSRFYGPVNGIFPRIATQDNYVKDIPISKGTIVTIQPKGNHFSSQYFKDPWVFRPQRWQSECDTIPQFAFVGFSSGPRSCIGKQLALLQSKIALVMLIKRYDAIEVPQQLSMRVRLMYEAEPFDTIFSKISAI